MEAPRPKDYLLVFGLFAVLLVFSWLLRVPTKNNFITEIKKDETTQSKMERKLRPLHLLYILYGFMTLALLLLKAAGE